LVMFFFFSSRRRHTRSKRDWSSDVCSSDLLSLMAIPGLTGYYSKDIIIESLYGSYTVSGYIMYYIAVASATLTSIYSLRVMYLRSEERRVGKECRCWCTTCNERR